MAKTDIKINDEVVVIAGAHKGKRAKVVSYDRAAERVVLDGVNLVKRHLKRTQDGQGGITEKAAPLHRSNVMLGSLWDARRAKRPAKTR